MMTQLLMTQSTEASGNGSLSMVAKWNSTLVIGFPLAPFILGVILGDQIEINLVRAIMTDDNPWLFLTRPISGGLLVASVLSVAIAVWQHRRQHKRAGAAAGDDVDF